MAKPSILNQNNEKRGGKTPEKRKETNVVGGGRKGETGARIVGVNTKGKLVQCGNFKTGGLREWKK